MRGRGLARRTHARLLEEVCGAHEHTGQGQGQGVRQGTTACQARQWRPASGRGVLLGAQFNGEKRSGRCASSPTVQARGPGGRDGPERRNLVTVAHNLGEEDNMVDGDSRRPMAIPLAGRQTVLLRHHDVSQG